MTAIGTQDRNRIYSEYQSAKNYRAVARDNGISDSTVRRIVREERLRHSDVDSFGDIPCDSPAERLRRASACTPTAQQVGYSGIDGFLKAKQPVIIGLINKYLAALSDDERISSATIPQIASAMSTLVEKLTVDVPDDAPESIDSLSQSFMELAARLDEERLKKTGEG